MPSPTFLSFRAALAAIIAGVAILWFAGIGTRALIHPDEGRYAEVGREMAASGDWITPRLNGLKYLEKPPLQYWLTAAAFEAFGVDNAAARLPTVASTLIAALFIGYVGWQIGGAPLGIGAGGALVAMAGYVVGGHVLSLDGLLAATLAFALGAFLLAQRDGVGARGERGWMLVAWAAMAAATLTKGLVGIAIPAATLVLYSALTRDIAVWRRLHALPGGVAYLALTAPWFVAVSSANPEFARFFFIHEHFERYLTSAHQRTAPWWYFAPLLVAGVLPWVTIFAWGAMRAWRRAERAANGFRWLRFALLWAAFVFVFFSASSSKLPGYIVPLFPALALVVGWLLARTPPRMLAGVLSPLVIAGAIALGVLAVGSDAILRLVYPSGVPARVAAYDQWVLAALAISVAGGIAALVAWRRGTSAVPGTLVLSLASLVAVQVALIGFDVMRTTRSAWDILQAARVAAGAWDADAPFYQIRMYDQTVPFYLRRTTTVVEFRDELALGLDAEPQKGIAHVDDWIARWAAGGQAYALMPASDYDALASRGVPMRTLARDARRVLVSRR
jgi:4-amino-4-deoxy-L-arabinose transferase-like glycosyltransferase